MSEVDQLVLRTENFIYIPTIKNDKKTTNNSKSFTNLGLYKSLTLIQFIVQNTTNIH